MRAASIAFLFCFLSTSAFADCTQADAVGKMQKIVTSSEYSQFVSQAGSVTPEAKSRTNTKLALKTFGGGVGSSVANTMQDRDNEKALAEAQASVANVQALNTTLNDAGTALGQGDPAKACALYDRIISGLGIE